MLSTYISKLLNRSLVEETFPYSLKVSKFVAYFKPGNRDQIKKTVVENLRETYVLQIR